MAGIRALSAGGCNVTSPYKEAVIPFLDQLSDEAKLINSVNTIVNRNDLLFGTSTDGEGFYQAVIDAAPSFDFNKPALIIGVGGAARAVAFTLAKHGLKELYLANRTLKKAEETAELLLEYTELKSCRVLVFEGVELEQVIAGCQLVIYCPPVDSAELVKAYAKAGEISADQLFFDLRYSPSETEMMKAAALAGAKTFNGLGMLFQQALLSFELFTGQKAPAEEMKSALHQSQDRKF